MIVKRQTLLDRVARLLKARPRLYLAIDFEPASDECGGGFGAHFTDMEDPAQEWLGFACWKDTVDEALEAALDEAEAR